MSCCEKWAKATGQVLSQGPSAFGYPAEMHPKAQIDHNEGWQVNGCCGGGCYVLNDLKFCPWCGNKLEATKSKK